MKERLVGFAALWMIVACLSACTRHAVATIPELHEDAVALPVKIQDIADTAPAYGVAFAGGQSFEVALEPADSARVQVGEQAWVRPEEETKAPPIPCRVTRVSRGASSEVGRALAWLAPLKAASVPSGEFVFARITLAMRERALTVPRAAVFIKDGATLVLKQALSKDGKVSYAPTEVELGVQAEDTVEIRSGLTAQDKITVQGGIGYLFPNFKESDDD